MITKLQTNPGGYDVIVTNCAWNDRRLRNGRHPADRYRRRSRHWADLNPAFRDSALLNADGKLYGVSWVWGITAVAYSTDVFKEVADNLVEASWDPAKNAKRVCAPRRRASRR